MKKFLIQIAIFGCIGILLLNGIGWLMDQHYAKHNNKFIDHKANWVFKKEGLELDYLIVGSSRAYNTIDVRTIDAETGLHGLNLGNDGAAYSQCYVLLQKFLEKNKTKSVVLSFDLANLTSDSSFSYPFSDYAFLPHFEEAEIEDAFYDESPIYKYALWKLVSGSKYMEFNQKYPFYENLIRFNQEETYPKYDSTGGSALLWKNETALVDSIKTRNNKRPKFQENDLKYLDKILSLCKEKNISVAGLSAPILQELYEKRGYEEINKRIDSLAQTRNLTWIDWTKHPLSLNSNYFADASHLNAQGAILFSKELAPKIVELVAKN